MDDMQEALNRAAASSDQAVRGMAVRYRELRQEFDQYEAFFAIYKQGIKINGTTVAAPRPTVSRERTTSTPRSSKVDTFSLSLQTILVAAGQPMKLNEIYATYQEQHPEDQTTIETFRQRLVKRRDTVTLIPRRGYWWAAEPLPEIPENV